MSRISNSGIIETYNFLSNNTVDFEHVRLSAGNWDGSVYTQVITETISIGFNIQPFERTFPVANTWGWSDDMPPAEIVNDNTTNASGNAIRIYVKPENGIESFLKQFDVSFGPVGPGAKLIINDLTFTEELDDAQTDFSGFILNETFEIIANNFTTEFRFTLVSGTESQPVTRSTNDFTEQSDGLLWSSDIPFTINSNMANKALDYIKAEYNRSFGGVKANADITIADVSLFSGGSISISFRGTTHDFTYTSSQTVGGVMNDLVNEISNNVPGLEASVTGSFTINVRSDEAGVDDNNEAVDFTETGSFDINESSITLQGGENPINNWNTIALGPVSNITLPAQGQTFVVSSLKVKTYSKNV